MYGFEVKWQGREQLPEIPSDMLFAGVPRESGAETEVMTPMITWGHHRAYVFDDRMHHQHAWLVVYGDGQHVTGGVQLTDFRHIHDIKESPKGIALDLYDASGRWLEITHLQLEKLVGRESREDELERLPANIPFCLSNGHDVLTVDEGGVRVAVASDALAARWLFKDGRLTHMATRQMLGLGIRTLPAAEEAGQWHLSPEGELRFGDGGRVLVADQANGEVRLQPHTPSAAGTRWQVQWPGQVAPSKTSGLLVEKLDLYVQVADDFQAGTSDKITFSINGSKAHQDLAENFERGSALHVTVDLNHLFPGQRVFADDLLSVELYQIPTNHYGPAWRMSALYLVVNHFMINTVLGAESLWLLPAEGPCWSGKVNWLDWRHEDGSTPLDYAGYTYPVQWLPMLADWLSWRTYDPASIDGVCQLIGVTGGKILAYDLKNKIPVHLKPNTANDAYTWVYTPQGSIIVKRWDKAASRDQYIRHSQLGAGKPVVCAGEFTIRPDTSHMAVQDLLGMINDASGHYKPDGGACLGHVLERLEQLGFDTSNTQVLTRDGALDRVQLNKAPPAA